MKRCHACDRKIRFWQLKEYGRVSDLGQENKWFHDRCIAPYTNGRRDQKIHMNATPKPAATTDENNKCRHGTSFRYSCDECDARVPSIETQPKGGSRGMGHHIDAQGRFQSDKYPDLKPDKIVLSFRDASARRVLRLYAGYTDDTELAEDIITRIDSIWESLDAANEGEE